MGAAYLKGPPALPTLFSRHWCDGKHSFDSAVLAHEVAARNQFPMQVYRCSKCGGFHIGSGQNRVTSKKAGKELIRGR